MSNPNNLIRPPLLNPNNHPTDPASNNNAQIEANIINIINRVCREQCRNLVENILNPNAEIAGNDQGIDERYRENLTELDKVPDIVRCLREFSGHHAEFSSWKKSVERVLSLYDSTKGTPRYFAILNVIRNKIIGAADAALESYNTPLNWESISRCLTLHYADKRDLGTLEYQMTTLIQGNNSVQDFYQDVYSHLSLIINNISCMTVGREAMDTLIQTYRDKALDTFIRGLRGDLSKLLCIREPTTLPQALHLCLKLQNQNFRTEYAYNRNAKTPTANPGNNRHFKSQIPNRPNRTIPTITARSAPLTQYEPNYSSAFSPHQYNSYRPQQFYNHRQFDANHPNTHLPHQYNNYKPQQFNNQRQFNANYPNQNNNLRPNNPPPRPFAPKPMMRPEPMEVDQSMQTKNVNYMNRPRPTDQFMGKRPNDQPLQQAQKFQRNFHIDTEPAEAVNPEQELTTDYYDQITSYETEEDLQPLHEYIDDQTQYMSNEQENDQSFADIHFLD